MLEHQHVRLGTHNVPGIAVGTIDGDEIGDYFFIQQTADANRSLLVPLTRFTLVV
jgi:hypothetical protein